MRTLIVFIACFVGGTFSYAQSALETYLKNPLENVFKVTSDNDKLTIIGYAAEAKSSSQKNVTLERGEVLGIWSHKWFRPSISVLTVPFKVRRAVGKFPLVSSSGLTNLGLNFAIPEIKLDRYFASGTKSTHSLSGGFWMAPTVEELTPTNTNLPLVANTKELYFSTAFTVVYSYNNIQLTFVPIGWDTATTTAGKNWAYNGRCWLGFGIGFDPKIFSPQINK